MNRGKLIPFLAIFIANSAGATYPNCPTAGESLESWRNSAIKFRESGDLAYRAIDTCFPKTIPACLDRIYKYTAADAIYDPVETPEENKFHELPPEFKASSTSPSDPVKYNMFTQTGSTTEDFEAYAKRKGWPTVRYKSRHSGGFDGETSSLLMIRIPGDSLVPPVDYDRYVNIALPADEGEDKRKTRDVKPVPEKKVPLAADYTASPHQLPSTVTMVTIQKAKSATQQAKVYFSKFYREDGSSFQPLKSIGVASCMECHPNGLRAISPLGFHVRTEEVARNQHMPAEDWKGVQEMNNSMMMNSGFKMVDWGKGKTEKGRSIKLFDPENQGPIYGALKTLSSTTAMKDGKAVVTMPTRTKEYITGSETQPGCATVKKTIQMSDIFNRAAGRDNTYTYDTAMPVNWEKVANAMNCASCHNNRIRGALTDMTDFDQIAYKILVDQSMPVGAHRNPLDRGTGQRDAKDDLNPNERIALVNCLETEFAQESRLIDKWFKEIPCSKKQVPASAVSTARNPRPGSSQTPHGRTVTPRSSNSRQAN